MVGFSDEALTFFPAVGIGRTSGFPSISKTTTETNWSGAVAGTSMLLFNPEFFTFQSFSWIGQ
jgi:hypothetical protein